ncbi:MAG: hypothetical protein LAT67_00650 [Balneolales bacterium]|nr:hypothetical protein [Balneolales bacterium]
MNKYLSIFFILSFSVVLAACNVGSHSHIDANGVVLMVDGEEIARQDGTTITYANGNNISMEVGETTGMISVMFIGDDNELFIPEGSDYFMELRISNEDVVNIVAMDSQNFRVELNGNAAGSSEVQFEIFHVDHSDYTSRPFSFLIQAPAENN